MCGPRVDPEIWGGIGGDRDARFGPIRCGNVKAGDLHRPNNIQSTSSYTLFVKRRELLVAFSGIMLATLLAALDQTIVATALPRIASDLRGFHQLSWVVSAYLVTSTITIPLYGKLSDLFGRRRLFVFAISVFVAGSLLCAAASSLAELVVFRAVQGIGAGGLLPLAQAAIGDLFPPRERGRYQGFVGSMWATAAICGPLLGGVLTDHASWRWIFLINLPLGGLALAAVLRTMPRQFVHRDHVIDWGGAALLSICATALLLACLWAGTDGWGSARVIGALLTTLVTLAAFVHVERGAPDPLLPLALFRSPVPRVTAAGAAIVGALVLGLTIYTPVFVQGALGRSATSAGTILIPLSLGWVGSSFVSGQLITRTGRYRRFPILGGVLVLIGSVALVTLGSGSSSLAVAGMLLVTGTGMGLTWPVYVVAIQNAVEPSSLGTATASLLFFRTMAGSVAVAALGALLNSRLSAELESRLHAAAHAVDTNRIIHVASGGGATQDALAAALHTVFVALVPLAALLLVLVLSLKELPLRARRA